MTPPNRVELRELGEPVEVRLDEATAAALLASRVATVERQPHSHAFLVGPTDFVGVARIAGVELWIKPKIRIDRLLFLLGYAVDPKGWQNAEVHLAEYSDLMPALAHAFIRQAERALRQGVLHGYRETEDSLSILRGRLREAEQITRRFGLAIPLEIRYDEFTVDIPENQLLLAAARRLLRLPGLHHKIRKGLLRVAARLADVTPLVPGRPLPEWRPTRLNVRYHTPARLAELVLRASSIDQTPGEVRIDGLLVNMAKVFEDFVTVALQEALQRYGGRARRQARHYLDNAERIRIRPDLVWYDDQRRPIAVVDAKYKAEKPSGFPDADLYQLLAYCTALHLPSGHLIYAKGNETAQQYAIRNAEIEITQHALDLASPPSDLLAQVRGLTDRIVAGARPTNAAHDAQTMA